jgi:NAD(P)-dependent dehydrogenase (short-subunit alcohol dehydrogenase family)
MFVPGQNKSAAIVIGASGGLGSAVCQQWQQDKGIDHVFAVSRLAPDELANRHAADNATGSFATGIQYLQCDYSESSIASVCEQISKQMNTANLDFINRVCICNGILHDDTTKPEKRLEDISVSALQHVFTINSVIPMMWLKALVSIVKGPADCVITVFSARIGSIGDNRSGGWYSYRASKAALNMLLQTAAIEYARRAKNVKLIAFHPGTTDTNLSSPFQHSVSKENLFTPAYVAEHLARIMNNQNVDGQLSFIDWENKPIAW